jgi:hypothetical protein
LKELLRVRGEEVALKEGGVGGGEVDESGHRILILNRMGVKSISWVYRIGNGMGIN